MVYDLYLCDEANILSIPCSSKQTLFTTVPGTRDPHTADADAAGNGATFHEEALKKRDEDWNLDALLTVAEVNSSDWHQKGRKQQSSGFEGLMKKHKALPGVPVLDTQLVSLNEEMLSLKRDKKQLKIKFYKASRHALDA